MLGLGALAVLLLGLAGFVLLRTERAAPGDPSPLTRLGPPGGPAPAVPPAAPEPDAGAAEAEPAPAAPLPRPTDADLAGAFALHLEVRQPGGALRYASLAGDGRGASLAVADVPPPGATRGEPVLRQVKLEGARVRALLEVLDAASWWSLESTGAAAGPDAGSWRLSGKRGAWPFAVSVLGGCCAEGPCACPARDFVQRAEELLDAAARGAPAPWAPARRVPFRSTRPKGKGAPTAEVPCAPLPGKQLLCALSQDVWARCQAESPKVAICYRAPYDALQVLRPAPLKVDPRRPPPRPQKGQLWALELEGGERCLGAPVGQVGRGWRCPSDRVVKALWAQGKALGALLEGPDGLAVARVVVAWE